MRLWDKISGWSDRGRYQHIMDDIKQDIETKYKPCKIICDEIIKSSINCTQKILENIDCMREKEPVVFEPVIFYEFIYFFMHATLIAASTVMTEEQISLLIEYMSPVVSNTVIDAYSLLESEDVKQKQI